LKKNIRGVEEEHKKRMRKITRAIKHKIDALIREQVIAAHKRHTDTVNLYQQYEDNPVLQPHKKQKTTK